MGGAAGLLAAQWALEALMSAIPWNIPSATNVNLDSRVLGFTLLVAAATSLVFGVVAYGQALRLDVNPSLKEGGARSGRGSARSRMRSALVAGVGILLAAVGAGIGRVGALALGRLLSNLLAGVRPTDPATYAAVCGLLLVVALAASYLPARRAASVDPMVALR
jgi:putative ABC transport system permease protein